MPFLVEADVTFDPENVNFLGSNGVMFNPQNFPDLIEQF
jgi:hypothetical protein